MHSRWFNVLVLLCLLAGWLPQPVMALPEAAPAAAPLAQDKPDIEVEPGLRVRLMAGQTAGYLIYFREKPDLSTAYTMEWIERGRFVASALQQAAERSQAEVRAYLDAQGVAYRAFWVENVISVESSKHATFSGLMDFTEISALRQHRTLRPIEPEHVTTLTAAHGVELNIAHVQADQAWAMGYDGAGMVVANIDTGVRYTHEALVGHYRGNQGNGTFDHNYNWWDPYDDYLTEPGDDNGHGTHTMGTMVGDDGGSNRIGIAPGARWMACRGCAYGSCEDVTILECAQFFTAPWDLNRAGANPDLRPNAVNNSWGDCSQSYDPWFQGAVDAWLAAGIYPVFAAGNASNCEYDSPPGLRTVSSPARYGNVTAVGSTGRDDGQYAPHSNWGPTDDPDTVNPKAGWEKMKPQVLAPGVSVRSAYISDDSSYARGSGTSMSAPHVTGLIALMWQAAPCLVGDYAATETLIEETAAPIPYDDATGNGEHTPNYAAGWGEINALAAVQSAADYCGDSAIVGRVTAATDAMPLANAHVIAFNSTTRQETITAESGDYALPVPSGIYTLQVMRPGYQTVVIHNVTATTGATTTRNIALAPATTYTVSGQVTDAVTGWPLYASLDIRGNPSVPSGLVWTDPATGQYSVTLNEGLTCTIRVEARVPGYVVETREIGPLTQDVTVDVALRADEYTCSAPAYSFTGGIMANFDDETFPPKGWTLHNQDVYDCQWWNYDFYRYGNRTGGKGRFALVDGSHCPVHPAPDIDLLSPVYDVSGLSQVLFSFDYDYKTSVGGMALVDVSADGGATWQNVITWFTTQPGPATFAQDVAPLLGGSTQAQIRFRYLAPDWVMEYWQVDNVRLGNPVCTAPTGSLVVGNVYDKNYPALSLTGATVVSATGGVVGTMTTPDDPAVDDTFYTIFAPAGSQVLTATTEGRYASDVATLTVAAGTTIVHDFYLPAGLLRSTPQGVSATVELGHTAPGSITLSNDGGISATVALMDVLKILAPLSGQAGYTEPLSIPQQTFAPDLFVSNSEVRDITASPVPYIYHGFSSALNILVYSDEPWIRPTAVEYALQDLGLTYTCFTDDDSRGDNLAAFITALEDGEWDLVIFAQEYWAMRDASDYDAVFAYIESGGAAIVQSWVVGLNDAHINHPLWEAMGGTYASWVTTPTIALRWWDADHPLFTGVPEFTHLNIYQEFKGYGARMTVADDGYTALGGFTPSPEVGQAGVIVRADGRTIYKGLTDVFNHADADGDSVRDSAEWWRNAISYVLTVGSKDVRWLSESPTDGALDVSGDQVIALNFDATTVDQPGEYYAELLVKNDTPYGRLHIPVTMTVTPPAAWGKITGVVTGLGRCDANPAPLAGVNVLITGRNGMTWTATTDGAGVYQLWLDSAQSPLTLRVEASKHQPGVLTTVPVNAGVVNTASLNLSWATPCVAGVEPPILAVTVTRGTSTTAPLTLLGGASEWNFAFSETFLGAVPWLTVNPDSGVVAAKSSRTVSVTFDASIPQVTQSGDYYATLVILGEGTTLTIPVTMTVMAPFYLPLIMRNTF